MTGRGSHHSVPIYQLVSAAVLFLLVCRPPMAAAIEFSSAGSYPVGISPVAVAVGDFNGDGKPDLAIVNQGDLTTTNPGNVSILLGNGDGTFHTGVYAFYAAGQSPKSIAVGDFNGDGKLDLAVANQGIVLQAIDGSVSILLGNGDGTFQPAVDYPAGKIPSSIAAGDFNGDGKLDLAVVNVANSQTATQIDGNLSILLGIGDGTFQPAVDYQPCPSPISVQLADFNHDGKLDVIAVDQSTANTSGVLLGNGDGTFLQPLLFNTQGSAPLVLGDFNGDGMLDLVQAESPVVYLYMGNGDGTFQPPGQILALSSGTSVAVNVATDINGDGRLDLVGWQRSCSFTGLGYSCSPRYLVVLLGRGDGIFFQAPFASPPHLIPVGSSFTGPAVAASDLNGDNLSDLVGLAGPIEGKFSVYISLNASQTSGADLAITMSAPISRAVGQNQIFSIRVVNEGPEDATSVTVTDILPPELTIVSATAGQGSCQGTSSISCDLGTLPSPGSASVAITATVNAAGANNTITNQASVSATESDLNTANNSASIITNVQDFQLSVTGPALTVAAGGSVTDTVSLSPLGGFNQTATLTCTGAPSNATCQISPASLTLDGSNTASATLTVKTTARSSAPPVDRTKPFPFGKLLPISWAVLLILLVLFVHSTRDPRRRSAARGITFAGMVLLVVMWAACGGGNNATGSGGPLPPQVSTLTVTATAGSFTQSTNVTLTIK